MMMTLGIAAMRISFTSKQDWVCVCEGGVGGGGGVSDGSG